MSEKLNIDGSFTILDEYNSLIDIVAKMNHYDADTMTISKKDFCKNLILEIMKKEPKLFIKGCLESYYGQSQKELIESAMEAYDENMIINAEWED